MRVLQIANGYLNNKLYTHLFAGLEENRVVDTVFVPIRRGQAVPQCPENVHVVPCFNQLDRLFFYRKQKNMLRWLEENLDLQSFDVIHAHTLFSGGYAAYRIHERLGIPYVVAVRNTDVNSFFKYMVHLRPLGVEIMRHAQRVVFLSPAYQENVLNKWVPEKYRQELRNKSCVIPNGIAPLFLKEQPLVKELQQDMLRLIYVGDINSNKNMELTVSAIRHLRAQGKNVTLTAIGPIKEEKYSALVKQTDFITHYDRCPQEEVIEHLRQADIFVMPSHTETFGLVYAEAMSQGLPVLYTKGQGFDGHFPDGTVGYAVSDTDEHQVAEAIIKVAEHYEELSGNGINLVERFDWRQIARRYVQIYQEVSI